MPAFLSHLPHFAEVLSAAALVTIALTIGSFVVALVVGLFFAVLRTAQSRLLQGVARVYVAIFRGLPTLTLLFVIYFGLPQFGIKLDSMTAGIVGLGLHGGAYLTEIFRAGIEAVHRGQLEGALSIGMTRLVALRLIIMPQAARIVVPPLANYALVLLKDTSIASAVAAPELTFRAGNLIDQTHLSTQLYLIVGLMYLAMGLVLSRASHLLERRLNVGHP